MIKGDGICSVLLTCPGHSKMLNKCLLLLPTGLPKPVLSIVLVLPSCAFPLHLAKHQQISFPDYVSMFSNLHAFAHDVSSTRNVTYSTSFEQTPPNFKAHPALHAVLFAGSHPSQHVTHLCSEQVPAEVQGANDSSPGLEWLPCRFASLDYNNYRRTLSSSRIG